MTSFIRNSTFIIHSLLRDEASPALAEATVFILLAAAAGAGIVAADATAAVANRLGLGIDVGAGIGLLLAALEFFRSTWGFGVRGARLDPGGANEFFVELLHLEDQARRLVANRIPHLLEQLHAFALVFD